MAETQLPLERRRAASAGRRCTVQLCAAVLLLAASAGSAQVITINTQTGEVSNPSTGQVINTIDRRYAQVKPTHVALSDTRMDEKTRLLLIRELVAERGFAMRPLPLGHAGLTLVANGGLTPAGQAYLDMVTEQGVSSKPGDPVVITDVKVEPTRIIFMFNGGPDLKHRFLRHIELGGSGGPDGVDGVPIIQDSAAANGQEATGSRVTLNFNRQVPVLTGADVKELLSPLIGFGVMSPVEAFTDTLPAGLKKAVLEHHVMVGMTTDMVLYAKGQPDKKVRETEGQTPFEEWIYGKPPEEVDFVRINGNRVIRVEVAKPGEELAVYTQDNVSPLMEVSGLQPDAEHVEKLGDDTRDPAKEAPKAPPTLRKTPDEPLAPGSPAMQRQTAEKPVQFPPPHPQDQPGYNPDGVQEQGTPAGGQPNGQAAPANGQAAPAGTGQQPAQTTSPTPAPGAPAQQN